MPGSPQVAEYIPAAMQMVDAGNAVKDLKTHLGQVVIARRHGLTVIQPTRPRLCEQKLEGLMKPGRKLEIPLRKLDWREESRLTFPMQRYRTAFR